MNFRYFIFWLIAMMCNITWILMPETDEGQGEQLALLIHKSGSVSVRRSGNMSWIRPDEGIFLFALDSIAAGADSEATMQLGDGSTVTVPAGTQLKFLRKKFSRDVEIALIKGGIRIQTQAPIPSKSKISQLGIKLITPQYEVDLSTLKGDFALSKEADITTIHPNSIIVHGKKESMLLSDFIRTGAKITIPDSLRPPGLSIAHAVPRISLDEDEPEMSLPIQERSEPASARAEEVYLPTQLEAALAQVRVPADEGTEILRKKSRTALQLDEARRRERERAIEKILAEPAAKKAEALPPDKLSPHVMPIVPGEQQAQISFAWKGVSPVGTATHELQWRTFCANLSRSVIYPLSQRGFLARADCLDIGARGEGGPGARWKIYITATEKELRVEAVFDADSHTAILLNMGFAYEGDFLEILEDEALPPLMAGLLMEALPTGWILPTQKQDEEIEFLSLSNQPSTPRELLVFELFYNTRDRVWNRKVKTQLVRSKQSVEMSGLRREVYSFEQKSSHYDPERLYWLQNLDGLNARKNYYAKLITQALPGFSLLDASKKLLFSQFNSSFLGFRYGKSMLGGSSIVNQSSLMSAVMEMNSGWLKGLRLNYDWSPRVRRGVGDESEEFSMSRGSIAWHFSFKAPPSLESWISRVDIQPKVGILNLSYRFLFPIQDEAALRLKFVAKNAYDLSLELGLEKDYPWLRTRIWGAHSTARFGLRQPNGVGVESTRAGLDGYFDISRLTGTSHIHFMSFAVGELLRLSKSSDDLSYVDNLGISNVSFGLFYVGSGFTLSW